MPYFDMVAICGRIFLRLVFDVLVLLIEVSMVNERIT